MVKRLLLLENEDPLRETVSQTAAQFGFVIVTPANFEDAKEIMEREPIDALIVDLAFDNHCGLRALGYFEAKYTEAKALIISGSVKEQGPRINWARAIDAWAA